MEQSDSDKNTLDYYNTELIMALKSFRAQAWGKALTANSGRPDIQHNDTQHNGFICDSQHNITWYGAPLCSVPF